MASYEVMEGIRKDSKVYRNGSYNYRKDVDCIGVRYMRCIKYRDGCPARDRLDLESYVFSVSGENLCPGSTETQTEISKVVSRIKRKSEISQGTLREIFDEEVNQSEVGGYISFPRLEILCLKEDGCIDHKFL